MSKVKISNLTLIKIVLWGAIYFSTLAFVYHIRWFIPFLLNNTANRVPTDQMPLLWFIVQISKNIIFITVGLFLVKLFRKYQRTGFFDKESLKVFNVVIISCVGLGLLGAIQTISNNFYEVHFNDWTSIEAIANLMFRSFTELLIFKEPQTLYILLAIILLAVKQFVSKALIIKNENEAFV
jgi:hypothetical protein